MLRIVGMLGWGLSLGLVAGLPLASRLPAADFPAATTATTTAGDPPASAVPATRPVAAARVTPSAANGTADPIAPEPAAAKEAATKKTSLDVPAAGRILGEGEVLVVTPGQNLTVESPAQTERTLPVIDSATGRVAWVRLPARHKQVVAIRWLDTSNIKKLVELEMLAGDLFVAVSPRGQADRSLALRGRKTGMALETPQGWVGIGHRGLKVHIEVDANLRLVGYGHPLLPGNDDPALTQGLHIFASLRPGALVQNAGATTLVVEQYDATTVNGGLGLSDKPRRVLLPPETSLSTNGGHFDLRHFYIPEPGQPAGPRRSGHRSADPVADDRQSFPGGEAAQGDGAGRAAEADPGVLP